MNKEKALRILRVAYLFLIQLATQTLITMMMWNYLMPVIFGLIEIDFHQALGLILLTQVLFKTHLPSIKK